MHYKRRTPVSTQSAKTSKRNTNMLFGVKTSYFNAMKWSYTDKWMLAA
jgi:hypothetical protein